MADVLVISGSAAYVDEWHDFPATSARVAAVIAGFGHSVRLTEDVEAALASPGPAELLVLNIGRPAVARPAEVAAAAARAGLESHLAAGGALLAMHSSVIALSTVPELRDILGGAWVEGRSMHPPHGEAVVARTAVEHPISTALGDFSLRDERYSYLEVAYVTVLFDHEHDGARHPLVWTRTAGPGRIVYDALGHDGASYDSHGHQDLIGRSVRWLLGAA